MDAGKLYRAKIPDEQVSWQPSDAILYALGIGMAGANGLDGGRELSREVRGFLYEKDLAVMPTFANVLGPQLFWTGDKDFGINWKHLLHAEQRLVIHQPLSASGNARVRSRVNGIRDKGSQRGALVFQEKVLEDRDTGQVLASVGMALWLRGDGGCGDQGEAPEALPSLPERRPDLGIALLATHGLPFVYRLSGDLNPLHVDEDIAREAGFERPILHGLCTMGLVCHALLKQFCSYRPEKLRELSLRFSQAVCTGDRLRLECWEEGGGLIRFRVKNSNNGALVIDRGLARIH